MKLHELSKVNRDRFYRLFGLMVDAANPDDFGGHLPNCGYTHDQPACGCAEFSRRLHAALLQEISTWEVGANPIGEAGDPS